MTKSKLRRPEVVVFRDWLLAMARETRRPGKSSPSASPRSRAARC
jgi:hypothetical protein